MREVEFISQTHNNKQKGGRGRKQGSRQQTADSRQQQPDQQTGPKNLQKNTKIKKRRQCTVHYVFQGFTS
jgi:hypothetical protein